MSPGYRSLLEIASAAGSRRAVSIRFLRTRFYFWSWLLVSLLVLLALWMRCCGAIKNNEKLLRLRAPPSRLANRRGRLQTCCERRVDSETGYEA
jgi:hypothetical protein